MFVSQVVGLSATILILFVSGEPGPSQDALIWGVLAGTSGVAGVGFFYLALARGTMGIVAPLAAVIGAGVPVIVAIIGGEAVSTIRLGGMGLALIAVVLISLPSRAHAESEKRSIRIDVGDLPLVVLSGLGFAGFFIGVDRASVGGEIWWPLAFVRTTSFVIVSVAAIVLTLRAQGPSLRRRAEQVFGIVRLRASGRSLASVLPVLLVIGLGDLGGNAFFVLAKHADAFAVAVVVSSLYPVVTTVLAALLLHERLRRVQVLGVVLATMSFPLLR